MVTAGSVEDGYAGGGVLGRRPLRLHGNRRRRRGTRAEAVCPQPEGTPQQTGGEKLLPLNAKSKFEHFTSTSLTRVIINHLVHSSFTAKGSEVGLRHRPFTDWYIRLSRRLDPFTNWSIKLSVKVGTALTHAWIGFDGREAHCEMSTSEFPDSSRELATEALSSGISPSSGQLGNSELNISPNELNHIESLGTPGALTSPAQTVSETLSQPSGLREPLPTANQEAIHFLASLDSLMTVSDTGKEIGEFTVTIQPILYHSFPCLNIHANSHGTIDSIPCGTSISAYVSLELETFEQYHQEYIKLKDQPLSKKTDIKRGPHGYVVTREVTSKQIVTTETLTFKPEEMHGFVSEASNLALLRILAQRSKFSDNMVFLSFDSDMKLSTSTYMNLGHRTMKIGKEERQVLGIQRTIHSETSGPMNWQSNFLSSGHLTSRVQVGSPATMVLTQLPHLREADEEEPKPVFEKKPLIWEEDLQLYSKFIDRTEALKADYNSYLRHHPELRSLMADFLEFLLLRKPEDVVTFAAEYFAPFSTSHAEQNTFLTSNKSSPFKEQEDSK
ncbi:ciliogenesis-associated TTC17-interacting protein [Hemiscyllium ocellatum]|uniref:ciliogenesis-associated TTC17-interacting protein n=1 Tax=Hemiscyllium ocellatum TaxID=170820 RepID=UPI002967174F|nr:ciliogenesis-associated TTC17-interacting protein [Hemiscyllium ocellatum]